MAKQARIELERFAGKLLQPGVLTIRNSAGQLLVELDMETGEHIFGDNYEPGEAARVFWDAVSSFRTPGP